MRFQDLPIRAKILAAFMPLLILPMILISYVYFVVFSKSMEAQAIEFTEKLLMQINRTVDAAVLDLERLSLTPYADSIIQATLRKDRLDSEADLLQASSAMDRMISLMMTLRVEIRGIFINAFNGGYFYKTAYVSPTEYRIDDQPYYDDVIAADGAKLLIATRAIEYGHLGREKVFSLARLIKDASTFEPVGVMQIDAGVRILQDIIADTNFGAEGTVGIVDGAGNLVYRTDEEDTPSLGGAFAGGAESRSLAAYAGRNSSEVVGHSNTVTIAVARTSEYTGWTTIGIIPLKSMTRALTFSTRFAYFVGAAFIILTAGAAYLISRGIALPLIRLKADMGELENRGFVGIGSVERYDRADEVGELGRAFSRMRHRIDELITTVYTAEIERRDAELLALQSRINPHFLYNTLETIRAMALEGESRKVADTAKTLGRLLRYGFRGEREQATVQEELENVRTYLDIQKLRFGGKLHSAVDVGDEFLRYRLPRLSLQPLVENAVVHGIEPLERSGLISITAVRNGADIELIVRDDGLGVDGRRLEEIRSAIAGNGSADDAYALRNVHKRISILFGENYGLSVDSAEGTGFRAVIRFPAIGDADA